MRGPVLVVLLGLAFVAKPAAAQVELDGSMGSTSGLVPGGTLPDGSSASYRIDESYGRRSGPNLFHSFSRFDIPAAQSAAFTGDPAIERVIGRVTGSLPSFINGTLRNTIEGADLYLFNPRGFFFSGTSSLDLRGSLYLSSANNLRFDDDVTYASLPVSGEVLSSAAPSAWGFTSTTTPGTLSFARAKDLRVPLGESLSIVGGPVVVIGVSGASTLLAPGGTISLASRLAPGEVPVNVASLSARGAGAAELGSINVGSNATLDVSDASNLAPSRGRIVIRGGALTVTSSTLRSDSAVQSDGVAPDIDLETTRSILVRTSSSVEVVARENARSGGLRLASDDVRLEGLSAARSDASGSARAGAVDVSASSLGLSVDSKLATGATDAATAAAFTVNAGVLSLADRARIESVSSSTADAPEISIAADSLTVTSGAAVRSEARGEGRGAALRIDAGLVEQSTGARIESDTFAGGAGGDVEITAESVELEGDPLSPDPGGVFAGSFGAGDAGHISIAADDVVVAGGAQVSAPAEGAGRGGDIEIDASRTLELAGASAIGPSGVFARSGLEVGTSATGDGGNILIEAPSVVVSEGAEVSSQTFGSGSAGGIHLAAAESVRIAGNTGAHSSVNAKAAVGDGGDIVVETRDLMVDDGGEITVSTLGAGDSGNVEIDAERVFVGSSAASGAGAAGIFAQSLPEAGAAGGNAGNINVRAARTVELRNASVISAQTRGDGDAGTVEIVAPIVSVANGASISALSGVQASDTAGIAGGVHIVAAEQLHVAGGATSRSVITARGSSGKGGNILIETAELRVDDGGEIGASTLLDADSGDVRIEAQRVYVGGGTPNDAGPAAIVAQSTWPLDPDIVGGKGGDIEIAASDLVQLENRGTISVNTLGAGPAGKLTIRGTDRVAISDGEVSARSSGTGAAGSVTLSGVGELIVGAGGSITTAALGNGVGGSIAIDTISQVLVANGGTISALSTGVGNAGSIAIQAGQRFSARNGGQVTTSAVNADGGDITIGASRLINIQAGRVTTDVRAGLGSGGNITLDPEFVVFNHAEVRASAIGNGGNITINNQHYLKDAASVVDASSELGIDGEIRTNWPKVDLTSELVQLDTTFLDASSKLAAACAARSGERGTFAVRGRARPVAPDSPLGAPDEDARKSSCDQPKP